MSKSPHPYPLLDGLTYLEEATLSSEMALSFAEQDWRAVKNFLLLFDANVLTFNSYRRELERLMQWAWRIEQRSLIDLTRDEIIEYIKFCQKPPISWIGTSIEPRFLDRQGERRPNSRWRPFIVRGKKGSIAEQDDKRKQFKFTGSAMKGLFVALGSFYENLCDQGIIDKNPVKQIKQKSRYVQSVQSQKQIRRLSADQWQAVVSATVRLAEKEPTEHERTLFILMALYHLYLRLSELAESPRWLPKMGDFYQDSKNHWWFKTVGKGNKVRDIAVSDEMLAALKRYRLSRGLSPYPTPHEATPLLIKQNATNEIPLGSTRHIRTLVQLCFDKAGEDLRQNGLKDEAESLSQVTAHWLRHTGISDDINLRERPIAHVRDDAGHASIATTDRYNDIEQANRYQSAKNKKTDPE